jgi:hypothetical protein
MTAAGDRIAEYVTDPRDLYISYQAESLRR